MNHINDVFALLSEMAWEEECRMSGAMKRARKIKTPKYYLVVILWYMSLNIPFRGIEDLLAVIFGEEGKISHVALLKRLRNAVPWLMWLCKNICKQAQLIVEKPLWLVKYSRVLIVDASKIVKRRGKGLQEHVLHCCIDLFTLSLVEFHLTSKKIGEKLSNFKEFFPGDFVLGDRAYTTLKGIAHLILYQVDFLLRFRADAFNLYDKDGNKLDLLKCFIDLERGKYAEILVYIHIKGKKKKVQKIQIRICAWRKDEKSEKAGLEKLKKANKKRKEPSELQKGYNKYVILITSVGFEVSVSQLFTLYRARWQIELVFKRLKTLFKCDALPMENPESVKAWFYGKLLVASLCQAMVNAGYVLVADEQADADEQTDSELPVTERSIWRELNFAKFILRTRLLKPLNDIPLLELLKRLTKVCKNSRRKRISQLYMLSSA